MAKKGNGALAISERLRVKPGARLELDRRLAESTPGIVSRDQVDAAFVHNRERLGALQYQLFVDGRAGLLVVLQAIDGGGKDSTIRHVCSAFNPQGCRVTSFKVPSAEEARHDFLWRIHQAAPGRGEIAVFNRSHYEDVLVARADNLVPKSVWSARYELINAFERGLLVHGIAVVKFLLHISKDEQRRRFEDRLKQPHKLWKFDPADLEKRKQWNRYMVAFSDAVTRCSTDVAPWYVIPANHKWYRDYAVWQILVETLESIPLEWPKPKIDPTKIRIE